MSGICSFHGAPEFSNHGFAGRPGQLASPQAVCANPGTQAVQGVTVIDAAEDSMQRMISRPATVLAAALVAACAAPRVDLEAERAALEARSRALIEAEQAGDVEASVAFWADDAVVHFAMAPTVRGKEALREAYVQFFAQLEAFEAQAHTHVIAASGDLAYELGTNRAVVAGGRMDLVDVGKYLAVWKKVDGDWYVAAISATSDAELMEAVQ